MRLTSPTQPDHTKTIVEPSIDDELSRVFPEIGNLSKEDLKDLFNDPDYFNAMFIRLPQVRSLIEHHQVAIDRNQTLADKNLSLQPKLENLRDQVTTSFNQTQQLISRSHELLKRQADLYQPFEGSASRSRLLTALHESDRLTESLSDQFVNKGLLEEDQFIKEFRDERTKYHKRAWVANRWSEGQFSWE